MSTSLGRERVGGAPHLVVQELNVGCRLQQELYAVEEAIAARGVKGCVATHVRHVNGDVVDFEQEQDTVEAVGGSAAEQGRAASQVLLTQ